MYRSWPPITESDEVIEKALADANIPCLMASLAHLSGDVGLLDGDIRPDTENPLDLQCGITPEQQTRARAMAREVLARYRDDGCRLPPPLSDEALGRVLHYVAGQPLSEEYVEFLGSELAIRDPDPYAVPGLAAVSEQRRRSFEVVIIGAGLSGILTAYRLKQAGIPVTVVEKSAAVGGTWWDNQYPEARVDTPSHSYAYSIEPYDWPQHFSRQPVLQEYLDHCVTRFGIREHIRLSHEVKEVVFDETTELWRVAIESTSGEHETLTANAVVSAVGQLNTPKLPEFPGLSDFEGPAFHSATWDPDVVLEGKRVAVVGTGASAMQLMPEVAKVAADVVLFQRNAPWIRPTYNYRHDVSEGEHWLMKHVPFYAKWYRFLMFWLIAEDMIEAVEKDPAWAHQDRSVSRLNEDWRELLTDSIKDALGDRPDLLEQAIPRYPPGAKRMLLDDGTWYEALKRDNVRVVTNPIESATAKGLVTASGEEHEVDVIVYATGFHANKFLWPMRIVGRDGRDLRELWGEDPRAFYGMTVPGFPNFFCIYGPNTNLVVNGSAIFFTECSVRYILGCLKLLLGGNHATIECRQDVHDEFNRVIDEGNLKMAWGAHPIVSWYKNRSGRVTQNWPFRVQRYWAETRAPDPSHFDLR